IGATDTIHAIMYDLHINIEEIHRTPMPIHTTTTVLLSQAWRDRMAQRMPGLIDTTTTPDPTCDMLRSLGHDQALAGITSPTVDTASEVGTVLHFQNTRATLLDIQGGYRGIRIEHVIHLMIHKVCHWNLRLPIGNNHNSHNHIKIITHSPMMAILTRVVIMKIWN
ncbi:hypothetical protein BG000_011778, partial [Podila horticola]